MKSGTPASRPNSNLPSAATGGPVSYAIFQLAKAHRAAAGVLLRELGLYPGQELLLMQLWDQDHRTQTELVRALDLDASTVARMVTRLERQGFVRRQPSPLDRRAMIVSLTERGDALRGAVSQMWAELEVLTVGELSTPERAELLRLFQRLTHRLPDPDI